MAKRVTYLIGAGASANALPVVNGMNERMKFFYNVLYKLNRDKNYARDKDMRTLYDLVEKCTTHQTIDTYAKKLWYKKDNNYELLKRFLVAYLLFEQIENNLSESVVNLIDQTVEDKVSLFKLPDNFYIKDENVIRNNIRKRIDDRYDSFFAANLNDSVRLKENINIISWNYDMQFELSFADFHNTVKKLDDIQDDLQVFPRHNSVRIIDINPSSIIKINGTATFRDRIDGENKNFIDVINEKFSEERFIERLFSVLFNYSEINTELKFAWEDDEQVKKAREFASQIIKKSDAVVIIGYSFPTFNREVDRLLFQEFNKKCMSRYDKGLIPRPFSVPKDVKYEIHKKIYIQDKSENALKVKERLKAVGDNLFEVAEIYDDVEQFFIPPEL